MNTWFFVIVPQVSTLCSFDVFSIFSLLFRWGNFCLQVHWFFPMFSLLWCWAHPLRSFFPSFLGFFNVWFFSLSCHLFIWDSFTYLFGIAFYVCICFKNVISYWSIFVMSTLIYLSDNSNVSTILLLTYALSFIIQFEIFLVLSDEWFFIEFWAIWILL